LYKAFEKLLKIDDWDEVQKLILSKKNYQIIIDLISKAKTIYEKEVAKPVSEQREIIEDKEWNIPRLISYTSVYKPVNYNKCIMIPSYEKLDSKTEQNFIQILDEKTNKIKWWFKNGKNERKWFAIAYNDENGIERSFYVDFIVRMEDGRIGLFDTKSGWTAKESKEKAEALFNYISKEKKKGKNLFGGITVFEGEAILKYFDAKKYSFNEGKLGKEWKFLSFR